MKESVWARWKWKDVGLGRWHAVVDAAKAQNVATGETLDIVRLACGRMRSLPQVTAPRPEDEKCCPTCRELDDLRLSYQGQPVKKPELAGVL